MACLGFSHFLGIGPHRFSLLIEVFGDVSHAYHASTQELTSIIGDALTQKFDRFRSEFGAKEKLQELKQKNIQVVTRFDAAYPRSLSEIPDPPICLYVRGNMQLFDFMSGHFFGIVGTRRPSSYGIQISRKFSADLTQAGFAIVSGMALGVDSIAHTACMEYGGHTIAVLGCGVDIVYPPQNKALYDKIVGGGGVVMSEFPPGMTVLPGLFVARNRLISGLSAGILVCEGLKGSGSLITASYAAIQGKDVYAPPVPLTSPLSEAPNILLKQGAKFVTDVSDILSEMNMAITPKAKENLLSLVGESDQAVVKELMIEPKFADDIAQSLNSPIDRILNSLTNLELSEVVEKNSEGKFQIKI